MILLRRSWRGLLLGVAILVFIAVGLHQATRDALVPDEATDLTAGLVIAEHGDLRMTPEHGLLHRLSVGLLPSLLADPLVPRTVAFEDGDWFEYTHDLVAANDEVGGLDEVVWWGRVLPLLLAAATGAGLYVLGRDLFDPNAGLTSALLWLSTPYVVGVAHLAVIDVTFTAALVLVAILLARSLGQPDLRSAGSVGLALGVAMLVRHQAIVLVPVVAMVLACDSGDRRTRWRRAATIVIVPLVVVWVAVLAFGSSVGGAPGERFDAVIAAAASGGPVERMAMLSPLPRDWRAGLAYLLVTNEDRPAYLLGAAWEGGRVWYLPVSGLLKLPASATVAVLVGVLAWWRSRSGTGRAVRTLVAVFGAQAVVLTLQSLNLGLRLGLPLLAAAFAAAGPLHRFGRTGVGIAGLTAMAAIQVAAFASAVPESLAWVPPPVSHGYRTLSDSSLDLGQGNKALREEHDRSPFVAASVLAPRGQPGLPGVPAIEEVAASGLVGRVAVGATVLTTTSRTQLSWLRAYCPVAVLEGSILEYRFDRPPDLRPGPTTPAKPCSGETSTRR